MKKYQVFITETLEQIIYVTAESAEQAEEMVQEQ